MKAQSSPSPYGFFTRFQSPLPISKIMYLIILSCIVDDCRPTFHGLSSSHSPRVHVCVSLLLISMHGRWSARRALSWFRSDKLHFHSFIVIARGSIVLTMGLGYTRTHTVLNRGIDIGIVYILYSRVCKAERERERVLLQSGLSFSFISSAV